MVFNNIKYITKKTIYSKVSMSLVVANSNAWTKQDVE